MNTRLNTYPIVILMAEDDEDDATLAIRAMKEDKIANEVYRVVDGLQAIDFLLKRGKWTEIKGRVVTGEKIPSPHLILLDLKMPRMDGFEFLRARSARPELASFRKIPVVAFTSSDSASDIDEAYAAGATSYIVKPVDLMGFRHVVRHLQEYWIAIVRLPRPDYAG